MSTSGKSSAETREYLRFGPFDAAECSGAAMDDLDSEAMFRFIRTARRSRQFPLPEETPAADLLRHLNLLNRGRLTNAVAHRDYTDNGSVQVMLFADRLEVVNSGRLPPALTVEKLRVAHQSLPGNPLLAEAMYLLRYIEKMGTGIVDMVRRCAEAGLPEPEFDSGSGFALRIWRQGATTRKTASTTQKTVRDQILDHLRAEPKLTRNALAERVGRTPDGVKYHLAALKEAGALRRIGSARGGYWEVL